MVFDMKLNREPFESLARGEKSVELRLFDDKRQQLNIGDYIIFTSLSETRERTAFQITALYRYATFEDLFMEINPKDCGFGVDSSAEELAKEMKRYYSEEQIQHFGVLGIRLKKASLEHVECIKPLEQG